MHSHLQMDTEQSSPMENALKQEGQDLLETTMAAEWGQQRYKPGLPGLCHCNSNCNLHKMFQPT